MKHKLPPTPPRLPGWGRVQIRFFAFFSFFRGFYPYGWKRCFRSFGCCSQQQEPTVKWFTRAQGEVKNGKPSRLWKVQPCLFFQTFSTALENSFNVSLQSAQMQTRTKEIKVVGYNNLWLLVLFFSSKIDNNTEK